MPAADPWFWTVDDLVAQVCRSRALFDSAGYGPPNCPDPQIFETQLKNQEIAGATFLTGIDDNVLRDDLGISVLGQRRALLAVVELLRSRSLRYKQSNAATNIQELSINGVDNPSSSYFERSGETTVIDAKGRTRRKVTQFATIPLPTRSHEHASAIERSIASQSFTGVHAERPKNPQGEWDYLLSRYKNNDSEVLNLDDDKDDAVDEEIGEDTEEEEEEEEEELLDAMEVDGDEIVHGRQPRTGKLNCDQVVQVINTCIDEFTQAWYPGKGEEVVYDPNEIWDTAQSEGQRQQLAERTKMAIEHYEYRLDHLCEEMMKMPWNRTEEVRHICGGLEKTVDCLEHEKWLLSIYELNQVDSEDFDDQHQAAENDRHPFVLHNHDQANMSPEIIDLGSGSESSDTAEEETELRGDMELVSATGNLSVDAHNATTVGGTSIPYSMVGASVEADGVPSRFNVCHGGNPGASSIASVARWEWDDLVDRADRKRIVMKIIQEMSAEDREMIRTRMECVKKQNLLMEIPACIAMLLRGENKMQGVLPRDLSKIITFTKLFLSWWLADNYFRQNTTEWRLEELAERLQGGSPDPEVFYDWLHYILDNTFSIEALSKPNAPSQSEIILISSDDDEAPRKPTPAPQNRVRKVRTRKKNDAMED